MVMSWRNVYLLKTSIVKSQALRCTRRSVSALQQTSGYIPRRACLYVPGNDERKLKKIPQLSADCVILDCEDGVAINKKEEARNLIPKILEEVDFKTIEPIVRVNSIDSGLAELDLNALCQGSKLPPTIMLPKVEHPDDINWFECKLIAMLKKAKGRLVGDAMNLIIFTESAMAMLQLEQVCRRAKELEAGGAPVRLTGVVFGSDDFCASIGATRTGSGAELLYARQKLVLIAKAFHLQAIDMVHTEYKDTEALKRYSLEGAQMGYTGKQVIHPGQVEVVQQAFSPTQAQQDWAVNLLTAFEEHQKSGKGAFSYHGHMIDMPLVLQARNIVHMSKVLDRSKKAEQ